jgi:PAS domain S-box-containing protein
MKRATKTKQELVLELNDLRARLEEAEETLRAIRSGEVDAVVVAGPEGEQVYTLKGAERPYRALLETMNEGALTIGTDGTILYSNNRFASLVGTPLENVVGSSVYEFIPETGGRDFETLFEVGKKGAIDGEISLKTKEGDSLPIWFSGSSLNLDGVDVVCGIFADLTDLKRKEQELETLVTNAPGVIFRVGRNLRFVFVNQKVFELTGIPKEQFYGRTLLELGLPRDFSVYLGEQAQKVFDYGALNEFEFNFSGPEGQQWFHARVVPEFDIDGDIETVLGIAHDITDLKRAELAYREERAFRESIASSLRIGIAAIDMEGRQSYVNPSFCQMVGWSKEELERAKPPFVYWPPEEVENIGKAFQHVVSSKESSGSMELHFQRRNGERFDALVLFSPLKDGQGNVTGWIWSIGDITDRKRKENEIRRLNLELEERVRQRTLELMKINRELEDRLTEIRQSEHLSNALNLINLQINSSLEFDEIMQTVVTEAAKAIGCETAAISLKEDDHWKVSYVYGFPRELVGREMVDEEEPHAVLAIRTRKPVVIGDAYYDKRVNREHMEKFGVRSVLVVPILAGDTPTGVIFFNFHAHLHAFSPIQVDFCVKLASSASFAIQNAQLLKELKHHAIDVENANEQLKREITERKQAELERERLRLEAENERRRLEAVMEALPVGVTILDAQGGVIRSNKAFKEVWGGPRPVVRSLSDYANFKAWWSDTGKPLAPEEWASAQVIQKGDAVVGQLLEIQRFDGSRASVINSGAPIFDIDGKIAGCAVAIQDITDLRKAEGALHRSREDLDRAQQVGQIGSWRLDVRQNVLMWSDENHHIFGVPKGTPMSYETFLEIVHPDDRQYVDTQWQAGLRGEPYDIEHRIVVAGRVKWVREKAYLEFDDSGRLLGGFGITQDITERKKAEEEIEMLNEDLRHRAAELELANKELEAFSCSVSHDLKAPLIVASGFCRRLSERCGDKLDDRGRHYLQRIQESCQQMNLLIDDLLSLSKVTTIEVKFESIDLSELAKSIATQLRENEPEREVSFLIEDGLTAKGDSRLLRVALENLLGNAWKYTKRSHPGMIEFALKRIGDEPTYFVRDNGCGFDISMGDRLFTPFQRLHEDEEFLGSGVGLATVHRIITRHGGTIWAESEVEKGATFFFTLPS